MPCSETWPIADTPSGCTRNAQNFLKRRLAGADFDKTVFIERTKALRTRQLFDRALVLGSPADGFADAVIDDEQFGYRGSSAVAGASAGFTANPFPAARQVDHRALRHRHL